MHWAESLRHRAQPPRPRSRRDVTPPSLRAPHLQSHTARHQRPCCLRRRRTETRDKTLVRSKMADGSSEDRVGPKQNMNDSTFSAPDKGLGDTKMCSGETFDGDSVKLSFYRELETSDSCEKSDTRGVAAKRAAVGGSYSRKISDANTLYGDDRKRRCLDRYDSSESSDR
ncbi:hypothetical protein PYW08_015177 [Mythimna loreyi]|uniref:Uncharacterized protein n=1 Tax=Mythimna loreyi TaxID=667449 RepID=A0ACC2QWV4_9NEOP|nr:hypothetical protein PYW08_015177 [Mythimna loreyi]